MKNIIDLVNINKSYGKEEILKDLNLYVKENEFLTLLGPSGCGKTTILKIIGGFEDVDSGKVMFHGDDITQVPPYKRNINTVFQKYALFPHMNIYDNIAFGLKIKKIPKDKIKEKVEEMLALVGLRGYEMRDVDSLSGGQQQRVAIARSLVNEPDVLLFDEPLGALDLKLRKEMQIELKAMQKKVGITFIYVTHDQEEALTMSDTVVVIDNGIIQQIGSPVDIYNEPKNAFVAKFIGESSVYEGIMIKDRLVKFLGKEFNCIDEGFMESEKVDIVIRPEDVDVSKDEGMLSGVIEGIIFKGSYYELNIKVGHEYIKAHNIKEWSIGDKVGITIIPEYIHVMRKQEDKQ